jgi:hypothetical protein
MLARKIVDAFSLTWAKTKRPGLIHAFALVFGSFILLLTSPATQADVWGFVDANGLGHYANHQVDKRYVLFFKEKTTRQDARTMQRTVLPAGKTVDVALNFSSLEAQQALPGIKLGTTFDAVAAFNKSAQFKPMRKAIQIAAKTHRVDPELIQAIIATESAFDHTAVSPKGAVGLMQLLPTTAQEMGVAADNTGDVSSKLTDPKTNIMAGTRLISVLLAKFPGQIELAIAAYNAGEGSVRNAGNQIPNFKETQNYVRSVLGLYASLKPGVNIPDLALLGQNDPKAIAAASLRQAGVVQVGYRLPAKNISKTALRYSPPVAQSVVLGKQAAAADKAMTATVAQSTMDAPPPPFALESKAVLQ